MTKQKVEIKKEIQEGINDWELKKNIRKKNSLTKEEFQKNQVRLTEKQQELYKGIRNNILTVVHGPAGTSKTFSSCYAALALLADKKIEKIIITKPIQESGENLGFLPGSLEDKLHPYKQSYYTTFCKILSKNTVDFLNHLTYHLYSFGTGGKSQVLKIADTNIPTIETVIIWPVKIGKLKDKTEKLNLAMIGPFKEGNQFKKILKF
jgi:predicted ribonuclease YlaK